MSVPDCNPVSTYEQALWWLIQNVPEPEMKAVLYDKAPLPLVVRLVCDTFWITPNQTRLHLKKLWGEFH